MGPQPISFALRLFGPFIVRDLIKNWMRTTITISGIALGVAVFLAIQLANETALSKFCETVDLISGKANLEITPATGRYLPIAMMRDIAWLEELGVRYAPLIQETAVYGDEGREPVQFIGVDVLADSGFFAGGVETDKSYDMFLPGAALIGWKLAETHNLSPGSEFTLYLNDRMHKFHVKGLLDRHGLGGAFSGNVVATDIESAQNALHIKDQISQIELIVPEDLLPRVTDDLKNSLPQNVRLESPKTRGANVEKMTRSFEYNLTALAFIALIVGMFLIYNTITISVVRRRAEIGTLRALGVSRLNVSSLFMLEALAFGIAGSLLGVACGVGFADGALSAIAGTMEHFYFQHPLGSTDIEPMQLLRGFSIGVFITVAAAIIPILEATTVQPAEATRRSSYESKILGSAGRLALFGVLLFIAGSFASVAPPVNGFPLFGYVAALCAILGMSFSTPLLIRTIFPPLGRSLIAKRLGGTEGVLAIRSLYGSSGRTSLAVASLMIGISMMVSLAIMISSFRSTVVAWVDQTLKADFWIQSASRARGSRQARIGESVLERIKNVPQVAAADGFVEQRIVYKGETCIIGGGDFQVLKRFGQVKFTSGETARQVIPRLNENSCLISESLAIRRRMNAGDLIELPTSTGEPLQLTVAAIYYDYSSDLGFIIVDRPLYERAFNDHTLTSIAVYIKPDADLEAARQAILNAVQGHSLISMRTTRELRKEAMRVFDRTFAVTYALHTIAVAVALLSVMNALFALSFESRRDFGILRYLGAQKKQIRRIVLGQSLLLGLLGNATGLLVGAILSLLLVNVINKQSFGWTVQLEVPWDFIGQSALLVIVAALAAGLIPAAEAAKTVAPEVVRDE